MNNKPSNRTRHHAIIRTIALLACFPLVALLSACGNGAGEGEANEASARNVDGSSNADGALSADAADLDTWLAQATEPMAPPENALNYDASKAGRVDASQNPANYPPIELEPGEMHFGVLPPGGKGRGVGRIRNVGDQPLRIAQSRPSCGCVKFEDISGRVIPPGETLTFKVGMDMKPGLGEKMQRVVIFFEGYDGFVSYFTKAEVSLPVRTVPPYMTAVQTLTGQLRVESINGEPFNILGVQGQAPNFASYSPGQPPRSSYTLNWDLTEPDRAGEVPWFYVIETDHPDAPLVDVRVRHLSTKPSRPPNRQWQPLAQRKVIGLVQSNQTVEFKTKIEYPGRAPAAQDAHVRAASANIDAELVSAAPDDRYLVFTIRVTPKQTQPGLFYEQIEFGASGYTAPLRIIGKIVE